MMEAQFRIERAKKETNHFKVKNVIVTWIQEYS